jgi:putative SOS response-associated peptidase YedK
MCGRFAVFATEEELAQALGCPGFAGFRVERRYNIAPGQWVITVRPERGQRAPMLARWGLVPSWSKDPEGGPKPINARAEGISAKPMFRGALRHGRCLIAASGFFEWKTTGKTKTPFFIRPVDGGIFIFAGLLDHWIGPDGELDTCAIVTTEANSFMRPLHDRMPVIMDPQAAIAWLDPENRHPEDLLKQYPPEAMEAWEVGSAVGNVRNNFPELIEPV